MSLKKTVKDIGIIGTGRVLITISSILLIPILTKNLGAYGYGLWSQAIVTVSLCVMLLRFGTPLSIARLFPGKDLSKISKELSSILFLVMAVVGVFSIILILFPNLLADAIFEGEVLIVKLVAIIIFVRALEKIFHAVFQAFREMKKLAIIDTVTRYVEVGLAVTLVILGYGIIGAITAILIARGIQTIVFLSLLSKKMSLTKPSLHPLKEHLSIGVPAMPGAIAHIVVDMSDRYVIGIFLGATFVGYYTPGYSLGMIAPLFLGGVLAFVLLPSLSSYYEKNDMLMVKRLLNLSTKFFLMITIPALVGIIIVGKPILQIFTTPEIAENGYIIMVLSAFAGILLGLYDIFKQTVFLKKRTKMFTYLWFFGAGINLIGNILFVPKIGIIAAAITTIISYIFVTTAVGIFSVKKFSLAIDYISIIKIIFASTLMASMLLLIKTQILNNFVFLIVFGIIIYASTLYVIKGIDKKEINYMKGLRR